MGWLFPPGWPLAWLFIGYPLWWILGVSQAAVPVLSAFMLAAVLRRHRILVPRGFGFWLLFLGWTVGGLLLLQVDAPGAVPGESTGRYGVWALRAMWYVSATIILLYIGNLREQLPLSRVARYFGWMFVWIVIGGFAGALFPKVDFPSLAELVLPHALTSNTFVNGMVHPSLAQYQRVLGYQEARPSAPFSYTNTWGLALATFMPFFVVSWTNGSRRRRLVAVAFLAAAMFPVVQSLNRGLWGALIGMVVVVAVRYAVMGRVRVLAALVLSVAVLGVGIVATPLGETIAARWDHQHSNEGRTDLGTLTFESVMSGSPVAGFGTTRQVQGNFNSIAGGATAQCPKCSPPSLGTQGQTWLLLFTTGAGGLLLYGAFMAGAAVRGMRQRSPYATAGLATLVAHAVTSVVYNVNGPGLFAIMAGVAFIWREEMGATSSLTERMGGSLRSIWPTMAGYAALVRRNVVILALAPVIGCAAGLLLLASGASR
ncbi:hypothetical protein H9L10_01370 [Phycicoccus endophyticus]|uniref:O-antigen ligase family protein n=1 Tax=Phycicoccus endophyticus TaxID=1690220 RepID=A0A7G9R2F0_9MICO|nr:hypothetical protein [Phycicoccus endophyticus]QNN49775.1 hypothetical protein H9L10_01370 [Phycicoccus endophyticus]